MNWNARSTSTRQAYRNLSFEQIRALILDGELTEADWVLKEGEDTWREIGVVPELADAVPAFTFRRDPAVAGEEDMDMTPMIDVVFQLLLFFMIITTFQVQKSIAFPDPGDPNESKNVPTLGQLGLDRILVSVDANNRIEVLQHDPQGKLVERRPVKREELVERFEEIARRELKTKVVIQADDKAKHETVVAVIDSAAQANLSDIRLAQPVAAPGPATAPPAPAEAGKPKRVIEDK